MSENGAILQTFNMELVKYTEYIKDQKEQIITEIEQLEEEKRDVLDKINSLNTELSNIEHKLKEKYQKRRTCEQAIDQSNAGLKKLIDSMKVLTTMMKKEAEEVVN